MVLVGRLMLIIGLIGTISLLGLAFWNLFQNQDEVAKSYFMAIPFSFLLLFTGLSTIVLFEPRDVE